MNVDHSGGVLIVRADAYSLTFAHDRPFVYLDDAAGERLAELFVLSSVHSLHALDDTTRAGAWSLEEKGDAVIVSLRAESSAWHSKSYSFRCHKQRFVYTIELEGDGRLAEVAYFGGYCSAFPRWGSGFFRSGQHYAQGFTAEPNAEERHYFPPTSGAEIDLTGVPLPGRGDWFYTPAPFCFGFQGPNSWVAMGVEAMPGEHRFTEYRYHAGRAFYVSLAYEGQTRVQNSYRLPAIGFDFAPDEFGALSLHVQALRTRYGALGESAPAQAVSARLNLETRPQTPEWWHEPIFCGWGAQCYLAKQQHGRAPDYARQALYDTFLELLDRHGINPGIVVLDDKWQAAYGENQADTDKWPDLRGFVDAQHARGRKLLLWLKAWDAEGLPDDECIVNAAGLRLAFDPSHPAFERRLRESIRRMLGPAGYDADGFKIDFTARIPSGPGIRTYGEIWGLELMKRYLAIVYDEAKRTKPEALVMTHTPHPYLADVVDMLRLNDMLQLELLPAGVIGRNLNATMAVRARVAAAACPQAVIDTDCWPLPNRAAWRDYIRLQPSLGVPSLYFTSHIDLTGEPLEQQDYQLIKDVWQSYRSKRRRTNTQE